MTYKEIADLIRQMDSALAGEFGGGPDPLAGEAIASLESEPLAEVEGWCRRRDTKWDGLGEWVLVLEEEQTKESPMRIRVIILPADTRQV